jgi:NADH-quinone oxidoreductase subunit C
MSTSLDRAIELATERQYEIISSDHTPFKTINAARETFKAFLFECKAAGLKMLADLTGVDYLEFTTFMPERFAVIYNLLEPVTGERLLVRVFVPDGEKLPSVTDLWGTADWHERETFDLFGLEFEGHPDLRKILTPEDLDGHPLRKDFPLGETPTLFREGRFIDPAAFRAGLSGKDSGLTSYRGGARIDSSLVPKLPTEANKESRGLGGQK